MKFQKIKFDKNDLENIPESERIFFIQILNLFTELNLLNKISVSYMETTGSEIADKAIFCHKILLTSVTAGKLYKGWEILRKDYFSGPGKEIGPILSPRGKECLKEIKQYFSGENILYRIRNKIAFHADSDEVRDFYSNLSEEEEFEIFWSEYLSNSFSTTYFSVFSGVLNGISPDKDKATELIFSENISKILSLFREFIGEIIQIYFSKYLDHTEIIETPTNINIYNPKIPFFFDGDFNEK